MVSVDLRAFQDPLAPVRRQREWQLEAARTQVATLQAQIADCEAKQRTADDEAAAQSACAVRVWERQGDPVAHRRILAYLLRLQELRAHFEKQVEWLRCELRKAQEAVVECQRRVEVLERHRRDAVAEFAKAEERRQARRSDEEWLVRRPLRQGLRA